MTIQILQGDCLETLKTLEAESVQCVVTSPPYYGLRDYGVDGQIGLEETPEAYVEKLVQVFRECRRVLRPDGTVWLNLGDSYAGSGQGWQKDNGSSIHRKWLDDYGTRRPPGYISSKQPNGIKPKDLMLIPARVAIALQADGWWVRSDIVWNKPNPMPESVTDRPTRSHEYIFLLSKSEKYYYDYKAILEPVADSSIQRLSQDVEHQAGSTRANGGAKSNGPMKAVSRKQDDLGKRTYTGFYERWKNKLETGRTERKMEGTNYGEDGRGLHGHSGYYDADGNLRTHEIDGIPARNKRDVWTVTTKPYKEAHFATFPPDLIEPCILAGSREGDTVLDPFNGSGTTGAVSIKHHRSYIGCELNPAYIRLTNKRLGMVQPVLFSSVQ